MGIFNLFRSRVERMARKKDVEGLIKALKDEDWTVRKRVAEVLGEICDIRAVEPLIQTLEDDDVRVRNSAMKALEDIKVQKV